MAPTNSALQGIAAWISGVPMAGGEAEARH